jgi:hypothetical protein
MAHNTQLIATLRALKTDSTQVIALYEQLFTGEFITLVANPDQPVPDLTFLTYPAHDGVQELPLFTAPDRPVISELRRRAPAAALKTIVGGQLWPRLLELVRPECQAAIDPGDPHGIRLSREMIV